MRKVDNHPFDCLSRDTPPRTAAPRAVYDVDDFFFSSPAIDRHARRISKFRHAADLCDFRKVVLSLSVPENEVNACEQFPSSLFFLIKRYHDVPFSTRKKKKRNVEKHCSLVSL